MADERIKSRGAHVCKAAQPDQRARQRIPGTLHPRYPTDRALPAAECITIMAEG